MRLPEHFAAVAVAAWDTFSASVSCWGMSFSSLGEAVNLDPLSLTGSHSARMVVLVLLI